MKQYTEVDIEVHCERVQTAGSRMTTIGCGTPMSMWLFSIPAGVSTYIPPVSDEEQTFRMLDSW